MGNEATTLRLLHNLAELEQQLQGEDRELPNQPLKIQHGWDPKDCSDNMDVIEGGLKVRTKRSSLPRTDAVRGKKGYGQGIHIWKIHWPQSTRGSHAVIGVATYQAPLRCEGYQSLIGSNDQSMGWDIVRNVLLFNDCVVRKFPDVAPSDFEAPDVITVILNMDEGTLGFKSSGENYGVALRGLRVIGKKLYPAISATYGNCEVGIEYVGSTGAAPKPDLPHGSSPTGRRTPGQPTPRAKPVPPTTPLKFKRKHGRNIDMSNDSILAERSNFMSEADKAVVLTSRELHPNEKFEVRVKKTIGQWQEGMAIGVVTLQAGFEIPSLLPGSAADMAWVWRGNDVLFDRKTERTLDFNLDTVKIGDKVGVMRKEDGTLHFFHNDRDMGVAATNVPEKIYGIVDVHGNVFEIEIVENVQRETTGAAGSSPTHISKEALAFQKMKETIDLLKKRDERTIRSTAVMVQEHLYMLYARHKNPKLRQLMGDKLVELNAAVHITGYIKFLRDCGLENELVFKFYEMIRGVCWNYSDSSLKFARSIGQTELLKILLSELSKYQNKYTESERNKDLVLSAFGILHNCSKVTENRGVYYDNNAIDIILPYTKTSNDKEVAMTALMTLSYLVTIDQHHLIQAEPSAIARILKKLDEALSNAETHQSDGYHAYEIVESLINLSKSKQNRVNTVQKGGVPLFVKMMKVGDQHEKELALNAVWELIDSTDGTLPTILQTGGLKDTVETLKRSSVETVRQAAERISLRLNTQTQRLTQRIDQPPKPKCMYKNICDMFVKTLKIHDSYYDPKYHRCFCNVCHNERGDDLYYTRGRPPKDYGIPIGWYRYALLLPPKANAMNVLDNWHRAFHGTKKDAVVKILDVGELLMPGDVALGGDKISEREGHFKDDWKPDGFDTKKIFVSPSIRYAGHGAYAHPQRFVDSGKTYVARVALQVCIRPGSYEVGDQTIGETKQIDPKFDNQEIEWSTKERGSTILYGLLVKIDEQAA